MKPRMIIGVLIILTGLLVAAYPLVRAARFEYNKHRLLTEWERKIEPAPLSGETLPPRPVSDDVTETGDRREGADDTWDEDTHPVFDMAYALEHMDGVISIEKISLRSPILHRATKYNLDMAVCAVAGSPEMGSEGNYCLAGHKSRIYGRHFNRLTELAVGDIITLSNGAEEYSFMVAQTLRVTPDDTWVLADTAGKTELTLITCDYSTTPVGRFIVRCEPVT